MAVERFPVEAGHVLTFRRALGHDDAERNADTSPGMPVPVTFVQASAQFDPGYVLRPRPDGRQKTNDKPGEIPFTHRDF